MRGVDYSIPFFSASWQCDITTAEAHKLVASRVETCRRYLSLIVNMKRSLKVITFKHIMAASTATKGPVDSDMFELEPILMFSVC